MVKQRTSKTRVTLHPHHAKPYRKRHVGLLLACLVGLVAVGALLVQYRDQVMTGVTGSRDFVADLFRPASDSQATTISSSYGFSLHYDQKSLYADAVDGATGKVYENTSLSDTRAYTTVQFAPLAQPNVSDQSELTVTYHPDTPSLSSEAGLRKLALDDAGVADGAATMLSSGPVTLGGHPFEHSVWQIKSTTGPIKNLRASISLYVADVAGHPFTIAVHEGFVDKPGTHPQYDELIKSVTFNTATARQNTQATVASVYGTPPSLLDVLFSARAAAASSQVSTPQSEKIAALYSPAVSRIYNIYCMDISFDSTLLVKNVCNGVTGSGFFVSQDGYMVTNGHVATADPKDLLIYDAIAQLTEGGSSLFNILAEAASLDDSSFDGLSQSKAIDTAVDKLYAIDTNRFSATNAVQNLLIGLNDKQPDYDKLIATTKAREKYDGGSALVQATVKAADYRMVDGIEKFHASDVAIIKAEGKNYPVVKLGSIDDVSAGDELLILGYPGEASDNGLVDSTTSTVTLTTGKVSSKKKASGSDKMLIETDTTIGHGNSGGPAFADNGNVIGIATYTIDGAGSGNGTYNYVRDIKDLKDLASAKSITFDTDSKTQTAWNQGLTYFYTAHYSKALPYFAQVKKLYPYDSKVDEFTATAKKRIADGEDVKDFPVLAVVIIGGILVLGALAAVAFIVRHKKKHTIYKAGLAQGSVVPMTPGVQAQTVAVSPVVVQPIPPVVTPAPPVVSPVVPPVAPPPTVEPTQRPNDTPPTL